MARAYGTWSNVGSLAVLAAWATLGCSSIFRPSDIPHDPLFVSRKPVEASREAAPPAAVAFADPLMPANPLRVVAREQPRTVPGILTTNPPQQIETLKIPPADFHFGPRLP